MKIRQGFVSNSSSSSFIISDHTTAEVMLSMLKVLLNEWGSYKDKSSKKVVSKIKKAIAYLEKNTTLDIPLITHWSCNYPSFVFKNGKEVYVSTCNNNNWDFEDRDYVGDSGFPEEDLPSIFIDVEKFR